jgi:hypothetical protein
MSSPETIRIDNTEYVRADSVMEMAEVTGDEPPYGGVMLIETVTKYFVGEVVAVHPQEIVIRDACWVACTGRYGEFLATGDGGQLSEMEPCPAGLAIIGRGSIISAQLYMHGLIRVVK